jgi:hypothetical protein
MAGAGHCGSFERGLDLYALADWNTRFLENYFNADIGIDGILCFFNSKS